MADYGPARYQLAANVRPPCRVVWQVLNFERWPHDLTGNLIPPNEALVKSYPQYRFASPTTVSNPSKVRDSLNIAKPSGSLDIGAYIIMYV